MPMDKLKHLCKYIKSLKPTKELNRAYTNTKILDFVETTNTRDQLFQGVDATGSTLESIGGSYSIITQYIKRRKGQPFDRVTLKDTGAFYRSIKAVPLKNGTLDIKANFIKSGQDLRLRWGKNLLGLTKQHTDELSNHVKEDIIKNIRTDIAKL